MADDYSEKKDKMRRDAQAEEKARLDSTSPPPVRILPPAREGELRRIHPDDTDSMSVLSDEELKRQYAPTLAEFESRYGPLADTSRTRAQYLKMESAPPPQPLKNIVSPASSRTTTMSDEEIKRAYYGPDKK